MDILSEYSDCNPKLCGHEQVSWLHELVFHFCKGTLPFTSSSDLMVTLVKSYRLIEGKAPNNSLYKFLAQYCSGIQFKKNDVLSSSSLPFSWCLLHLNFVPLRNICHCDWMAITLYKTTRLWVPKGRAHALFNLIFPKNLVWTQQMWWTK